MPAETNKALTTTEGGAVAPASGKSIQLGTPTQIDTTGLSDEQIQALKIKHAESMIEINKKAQELNVDVRALGAGLDTMANTVKDVAAAGNSVQITSRQKSSFGDTESIMGNTQQAATGRMPWTSTVLGDHTMKIIIIGAIVLVALAVILSR